MRMLSLSKLLRKNNNMRGKHIVSHITVKGKRSADNIWKNDCFKIMYSAEI